jgi:amino acid adenylation domain-containing protein
MNEIAIVGFAGRFPGAADVERLWENLAAGVESITTFRREEMAAAGVEPALLDDPAYVPARGVVDGAELFDAELFGYSPREAGIMDPQHRLLLEHAWEALEHAGYDPLRYEGLIGVYAGAGPNAYLLLNLMANREALAAAGPFQAMLGNGGDFLATRLSYKLGLRGPGLTVQTACSTSLVAVHLAVQSLLNGECDMALAGGVRVAVPRRAGHLYQTDGILSPDGHCRAFDAAGQGAVDGEGAGIVVLKRLADALEDGDHVHAVILGTAINNDGAGRVGYTAPGVEGQAAVIAMAQALANVHPETIGLVEGHGTATPLGDPVEVAALRQVFEAATPRRGFCALGSVKSNIGHLDAAAGVASLLKAVLALEREVIPPTVHFRQPNPRLGLEESPFFVNAGPLPWPRGPEPRRAAVSSFGMGGTNAHIILEEAPPVPPGSPSRAPQLLVLSAASAPALEALTDRLADHLARHPGLDLADVAFTLQVGRRELAHRRMLVCRSVAEAREALASRDPRRVVSNVVDETRPAPEAAAGLPLETLGELWLAGAAVDWHALHAGERRLRVVLPSYPFQRQRYWIGPPDVIPAPAPEPLREEPRPPSPRRPRPRVGAVYVAPRSERERRLSELFQDILGIEAVGAFDRFFDLGGHSLLGLQLLSRVKSELGAEVKLEWLFQAATPADLAELIGLIEEEGAGTAGDAVIPRTPRNGDLPLSFAQERLWLLDRLDPGTPTFNLTDSVRLTGRLDVPALGRALAEVVCRHESLRTAFVDVHGRPVQRILPAVHVPLPLVDLSALPEERREDEAGRLATRAGERRFDLSRPPLLAAELYRLGPDRHAVTFVFHHIIGDGWSGAVLLSDLTANYRAFAAGEPSPLPELPIQYADFASWQRRRLGEREMAEQLAGWRERLAPPLPVLDLPTDRPRPAVQTFRGTSEVLVLPPELANALRGLGADQGATLFMVLLAGFALVLSRWSGQEDLIVGSPIAGRDRRELEPLIGIFLNMLPLGIDLSGDPDFRGLLGRVRETALAAYAGQEVPVERIIEEVQPGRDLSRSPLFQVLFNFLAFPHPDLDVPGLAIEAFPLREMPSRFDFTIYAEEVRTGGVSLDLVYNADLYDRATMAGFLSQLGHLLERAAAKPDTPVSRISLVNPEAAAVLPDPHVPLGAGDWKETVQERFAEQARQTPERPAVIDSGGTWTYGELAERAGRLAAGLRNAGIGEKDVVAIYAWRNAPLVQALLGVLEAGAAFVILDPSHPAPRLRSILRQARPRAWINVAPIPIPDDLAEALPPLHLDPDGEGSPSLGGREGDRRGGQGMRAYIAFTSGSTGEPKGVLGTHGPLAHFCAWQAETFGLSPDDRFSLLSGLSHDPLLRDVFTPLGLGATLCIPDPDDLGSPARLSTWMARSRVTVCHLTPAFGQVLTEGGTRLPDLRYAFFGGDMLTERDVARLRALAPAVVCVNFYGTTETPQAVAWFDASGAGAWPARRVPVGWGIDGVQLLVLNTAGILAAPGELGEVCVRTPHLSLGYLGDERLTAERYVTNPATGDPADRVYRTGDLGRYRADGAVDLAGRRDGQVQVRGFRVEPAEVEAALSLHPAVRETAVLLRNGVLTAWLAGSSHPRPAELRDFLRGLLPDPMIPEAFVWLDSLPLTPNGKLDRRALPDPAREEPREGDGFEPPANPVEEGVAAIWSELLALDRVGRHDDFFDLGGHSLLAARVVAALHERFGVDVPLRTLFEKPTVAGVARAVAESRLEQAAASEVEALLADLESLSEEEVEALLASGEEGALSDLAGRVDSLSPGKRELLLRRLLKTPPSITADRIPAVPRHGDLPLSFGQQRLWFLDQLQPGSAAYNLPAAVRLAGRLDVAALHETLREIVRRHEVLRTSFAVRDGQPVQVIATAVDLPLAVVNLSGLGPDRREAELRDLASEESLRPFGLHRAPLLRAVLVRLGEGEHALLLTFHHIASDGWSLVVLVREMAVLYRAFSTGEPSPLPELPVQYADFAVWQREWLRGEVLDRQLAWWRDRLAGAPVLQLPTDRPRMAFQSYRGATRALALAAGTSELLRELGRRRGATPFMTLLAGFEALLYRSTAQDDLIVGSTVASRTRRELEGLIGFFVNTLALRAGLSGDPPFDGLVDRAREAALGAFAHQHVPFEKLVAELQPERDLSRAPLFQVVCQFQNAPVTPVELPGLRMTPVVASVHQAKFDLVLNLWEEGPVFKGELRYDTGLFEPATAERMVRHFETLLAGAVAEPFRRLSELPLLSEPERQQLLEWGGAPAEGFEDGVLHELFAFQAARAPEATAVIDEGERRSYGELDARANRLARFLIGRGVGPGDRVALFLERGAGMVVALLGTLKAGAAYVPLDPASPAERLAFLVEDSRPQVLVTSKALAADLPEIGPGTRLVLLDRDEEEISHESGAAPAVPVSAEHPAYVIYTSGSTGRPKGVVVRHGNAVRLFTATAHWFGFGPEDVWTLFHSYAFDFSVWELWGALLYGGRVVVVPFWVSRSPEAFYDLLRCERVTVLNQTPSAFRQLIWAEDSVLAGEEPDLALRWVIFGGEALEPASLAPWFDRHGDARPTLVNMYGITETTVHVTFRPVRRADLSRGSVLGRPIPDLSVHVLDRHLQLQPIGVPGELHVGGAGLAQGYLDRPDLTAGRFVPDPFSGEPGARLYRSGDLARRLPDGDLEYLGRIDHQVKIRGFRIEPGEIEAALASHPGIRETVVLAREGRLVAYVVPAPGEAPDPADLRASLARRLPDYMIPSAFVFVPELPLTGNGKIDRRALPPPDEAAAARDRVLPRTDLERFLAGQIRDVLGLSAESGVGLHDDFFELGGSSISGAILIHRLQEALGEIVHVVTIFDHPSVASLAAYVKEQHPAAARRIWGEGAEGKEVRPEPAVGPAEVEEMRRLIALARPEPAPEPEEPLNPPALFVLSPPRSGSTLLRVMLGVHPGLFAPPELELLSFRTLAERSAAFQGRDAFWREGLVRAVMEARRVTAAEAERILGDAERQGWTTQRFYRELQGWLGVRMLVDKTPSYALDPEVLRRAEAGFAGARYLHLVRHPQAALRSFEEARLDQIFFRRPHPFTRRQLAELVWTVSHRNILDFLAGIPRERWTMVRFEDLVREPQRVLREVCGFLGIEHLPEMADPYREGAARMVDGPHAVSRMLGDVKLLAHGRVDPAAAESWREAGEVPLGAPTHEVAGELGYPQVAPERDVLVPLQEGSPDRPPLFCVHPVGGEVLAYRELARHLPGQTVYGLQSPGNPVEDLRKLAALYVDAVQRVQARGPYRLAGWSMGGVVAFEMARQLGGRGERVELLALIDTVAPAVWNQEPEPDEAGLVAAFALDLARSSGAPVPNVDLSGLDEEGALALVLSLGKEAGLLAPGVELPELRLLFERFRANRRALSGYQPAPYPGEAILFRARERPAGRNEDPALGWRGLVAALSVHEVPGDHYTILRDGMEIIAAMPWPALTVC